VSARRLEDLLRASVVQVDGVRSPGTGFFIAPGLIVTCAHIVQDPEQLTVFWSGDGNPMPAEIVQLVADRGRPIPSLDGDYPDIAVLRVESTRHPCVAIDTDLPQQDDRFQTYGFPAEGGAVGITPASLRYRGIKGEPPTEFIDLASDTVKPGMSGAPLLNLRTQAVGGVVVATRNATAPDGGLAVPWASVEESLAQPIAASAEFHESDGTWRAAGERRSARVRFRLPLVTEHFVGREEETGQISRRFAEKGTPPLIQPIIGLGGIGKTQLAADYVRNNRDRYDLVAWIRADEGPLDLARLAVQVGAADPLLGRQEQARRMLDSLCETDLSWLLVLDNMDSPTEMSRFCPSAGNGHVLVTTRHQGLADFGPPISVEAFDASAGALYLLRRTGRLDEEESAHELARNLGGLPLALSHAAAYCATGTSFPDYLDLLQNLPARELFDSNLDSFYEQTVASTWQVSVKAAEAVAELAPTVLAVCSYLAPDEIPRPLFDRIAPDSENPQHRKSVLDALAALHRFSLVDARGEAVNVHRLLQKVTREDLVEKGDPRGRRIAVDALANAFPPDFGSPAVWPQIEALLPHVFALSSHREPPTLIDSQLVLLQLATCRYLEKVVSVEEHAVLAAVAAETSQAVLGPDHHVTLVVRASLVKAHQRLGKDQQAVESGAELLADVTRVMGVRHPETLRTQVVAMRTQSLFGRSAAEIGEIAQVVPRCEEVLGADDPITVQAKDYLATVYMYVGKFQEAIDLGEEAWESQRRVSGAEDPETITTLSNLATYCFSSPDHIPRGVELSEEVLALRERVLGPKNPNTLASRTTLSDAYRTAGRVKEAIETGLRAVHDCEAVLGEDRFETITARVALGLAYQEAERFREGSTQYELALAASARIFGTDHIETIATRATLATMYARDGRCDDAIDAAEESLSVAERVLDDRHPVRASVEFALQTVCEECIAESPAP
jgi:tetratricopeptide (TPR) repeat protein